MIRDDADERLSAVTCARKLAARGSSLLVALRRRGRPFQLTRAQLPVAGDQIYQTVMLGCNQTPQRMPVKE